MAAIDKNQWENKDTAAVEGDIARRIAAVYSAFSELGLTVVPNQTFILTSKKEKNSKIWEFGFVLKKRKKKNKCAVPRPFTGLNIHLSSNQGDSL